MFLSGITLNENENKLINCLCEEFHNFEFNGHDLNNRILIFPPLHRRFRFLIHKVTEKFAELHSFSVGEGWDRRCVICFIDAYNSPSKTSKKLDSSPGYVSGARHLIHQVSSFDKMSAEYIDQKCTASADRPNRTRDRQRRPDQQVYVPRAKRASATANLTASAFSLKSQRLKCENKQKSSKRVAEAEVTEQSCSGDKNASGSPVGSDSSFNRHKNDLSSTDGSAIRETNSGRASLLQTSGHVADDIPFSSGDDEIDYQSRNLPSNESEAKPYNAESSRSEQNDANRLNLADSTAPNIASRSSISFSESDPTDVTEGSEISIHGPTCTESDSRTDCDAGVSKFRNENPSLDGNEDVDTSRSRVVGDESLSTSDSFCPLDKSVDKNAKEDMDESVYYSAKEDDEIDDDSWDALFDDHGECLNPVILKELDQKLGRVKVTSPKIDYLNFSPPEIDLSGEEFKHVVELYDFPVEFKTQDLVVALSQFKDKSFDIKWVDDNHALAVFSSPVAAAYALTLNHVLVKMRPLSEAIHKSKQKARHCGEFLLPYKQRPQTSALLARNLVTGALGLQSRLSKGKQDAERKKLREAKEKKKLTAKLKEDIWEGKF